MVGWDGGWDFVGVTGPFNSSFGHPCRFGERYTKLLIRVKPPDTHPQTQDQLSVEEVDSSNRPETPFSRFQRTISRQGQRLLNKAPWRRLKQAASREEVDTAVETPVQRVQAAILSKFSGRIVDQDLIDTQEDSVTFQLPKNSVPLSEIFQVMEDLHRDLSLKIVGYSVSQSTLNQVTSPPALFTLTQLAKYTTTLCLCRLHNYTCTCRYIECSCIVLFVTLTTY